MNKNTPMMQPKPFLKPKKAKKFTRKTVEAGESSKYSKQALKAEAMMGMSDKKEKGI
jgi:hypothetical protein